MYDPQPQEGDTSQDIIDSHSSVQAVRRFRKKKDEDNVGN